MARTKQPAIKREPSSEYFNKETATWEKANGNGKASNGLVPDQIVDLSLEKPDAGVVQLVIAVAGIYASL